MKYYLMNNGSQQSGPFELNDLLGNGLTPQSYVWNETMSNWLPAMQVPEVAAMLNTQQCPSMPVNNAKEVGFTDALGICFKKSASRNMPHLPGAHAAQNTGGSFCGTVS